MTIEDKAITPEEVRAEIADVEREFNNCPGTPKGYREADEIRQRLFTLHAILAEIEAKQAA